MLVVLAAGLRQPQEGGEALGVRRVRIPRPDKDTRKTEVLSSLELPLPKETHREREVEGEREKEREVGKREVERERERERKRERDQDRERATGTIYEYGHIDHTYEGIYIWAI